MTANAVVVAAAVPTPNFVPDATALDGEGYEVRRDVRQGLGVGW